MQESQLKGEEGSQERRSRRKLKISIPKWCGKWVVSMDEYKDGVVGAKSKNIAGQLVAGTHSVLTLLSSNVLQPPHRT